MEASSLGPCAQVAAVDGANSLKAMNPSQCHLQPVQVGKQLGFDDSIASSGLDTQDSLDPCALVVAACGDVDLVAARAQAAKFT